MLSRVVSAAVKGIEAYLVQVEIDISPGLPMYATVGLPDTAVRESKDRVMSALRNSGFDIPTRRVVVNLAPADVKKEGACFDLPIAVGIISALQDEPLPGLSEYCLVGELALDGTLRPVHGILPIAINLKDRGINKIILPETNAPEAAVARGVQVFPARTLSQVIRFLNKEELIEPCAASLDAIEDDFSACELDFADVKGQYFAKRALEVAAAGGHNVVMVGPPGSGKTMLAKRLPAILPPFAFDEALETTKIHSVAGFLPHGKSLVTSRPFRSPHHTTSAVALAGGGSFPKPGEVSLAHNGVLFLDEFTEFHRDALEVLRQPLEDRVVTVSRAKHSLTFPASFMLVGAMNPCPCGNYGHPEKECLCTPFQVRKYRSKISGPLLDRIDIHLEVPALKVSELMAEDGGGEPSRVIRKRVMAARLRQHRRFAGTKIACNSRMSSRHIKKFCPLDKECKRVLHAAVERLGLSGRAFDRVVKVSRTIADMDGKEAIEPAHLAEAVQYRNLDRY